MIKRWNLVSTALIISLILLTGCTTEKPGENLKNPEIIQSPSQTGPSLNETVKTPAATISTIKISQTPRTSWFIGLDQNETAYNRYPDNTSYNLSISDVTFRKGVSSGTLSSYITKINITAKNGGPDSIGLIIGGVSFSDKSGNGCGYVAPGWCGLIFFDKINPGESQTKTANVTFFSKKDFNNLSLKKFEYEVEINEDNLVSHRGIYGNRNSWIINIKNST